MTTNHGESLFLSQAASSGLGQKGLPLKPYPSRSKQTPPTQPPFLWLPFPLRRLSPGSHQLAYAITQVEALPAGRNCHSIRLLATPLCHKYIVVDYY
jgi:hypothetical protein